VQQEVVLGYWEQAMRTHPQTLQAEIDGQLGRLDVPCLGIFGRPISDGERERFRRLPHAELEEWSGDGHFVHLVDPDRFAARLLQFAATCDDPATAPCSSRVSPEGGTDARRQAPGPLPN
jgi:pimeloyl-ACP methyl ester carboxylesterase